MGVKASGFVKYRIGRPWKQCSPEPNNPSNVKFHFLFAFFNSTFCTVPSLTTTFQYHFFTVSGRRGRDTTSRFDCHARLFFEGVTTNSVSALDGDVGDFSSKLVRHTPGELLLGLRTRINYLNLVIWLMSNHVMLIFNFRFIATHLRNFAVYELLHGPAQLGGCGYVCRGGGGGAAVARGAGEGLQKAAVPVE